MAVARNESLWKSGALAVGGALIATSVLRAVGVAVVDVPPEFPPLDGPGPAIFFTTVLGGAAVAVYAAVRRLSERPDRLFRGIAAVALLLSFLPDLWLLSEGGGQVFPGGTPGGVGILMTMHVAAAVVIVWTLTGRRGTDEESGPA
jgi:hypothetical protein